MPPSLTLQSALPGFCPVTEAIERLATESGIEQRGAIYTRREVVDFILDLVGYTADQPLTEYRLLEPSFGDGDFIFPALERLLSAAKKVPNGLSFGVLAPTLRGVELHRETFAQNAQAMRELLVQKGVASDDAAALLDVWLRQGDFLLSEFEHSFTHVVGNPPYLRQESIPDVLIGEYRQRFQTIYDRADIYVPFIEQSLSLLSEGGKLSFICADRWMKNRYGRKLRALVSEGFSLKIYVDMVGTDAFHSEVSAYPAITVIERSQATKTRVFARPAIDAKALKSLASDLTGKIVPKKSLIQEVEHVALDDRPWVLESFDALALARRLEQDFPSIEEAGCKVGIGVATGADRAFIGDFEALKVEPCRKLPLVMTKDILNGHVEWRGKGVVNPFGDDGKLVPLEDFPKLRAYLEARKEEIAGRHIAEKAPHRWYRTIDRIYPELTWREKLLIPDIKGDASIVYEPGELYPHHNLYFITSDAWDVHALQSVMRSGIARLFVSLYSTKMRGGYLRFQAQYLRRIRLPEWSSVSAGLRGRLAKVSESDDPHERNAIVAELYSLTDDELRLIEGRG